MRNLLLLSMLALFVAQYEASNILILTPMGSKSHKNFFMGIANALVERGHQVTIVSAHKNSKTLKNVKDVVMPGVSADYFVKDIFVNPDNVIPALIQNAPQACTDTLLRNEITELKKEKFDLILISLFFSECYFSLVHHFKVPFGWLSPAGLFGMFNANTGNVGFPSIVPNLITSASPPLSFTDRLTSIVIDFALERAYSYYTLAEMERICREKKACPPDMPPIEEFFHNASITVLNSIQTLDVPQRPTMPNTFHVGGIHCVPAKPLPKDLEEWFEGSGDNGVIFFSLGSAVTPSDMPEKFRKILIKVFGSLKQRVLWKWNQDSMDDLPPNVRIGKWLPQQDILGHPKTKLFITHGGLLSTMESTYHGCPMMGMPVFADQFNNIKKSVVDGWGMAVHWKDLTEELLYSQIQVALTNEKMKENIKKRAQFMNDVEMNPKDRVTYWIEYVIRYDGAPHMRSPISGMSFITFYNIDVWATIIGLLLLTIYLIFAVLRCIYRCVCCRRTPQKLSHEKKKKKKA